MGPWSNGWLDFLSVHWCLGAYKFLWLSCGLSISGVINIKCKLKRWLDKYRGQSLSLDLIKIMELSDKLKRVCHAWWPVNDHKCPLRMLVYLVWETLWRASDARFDFVSGCSQDLVRSARTRKPTHLEWFYPAEELIWLPWIFNLQTLQQLRIS